MNITAVVLTKSSRQFPALPGLDIVVCRGLIRDAAEFQSARYESIRRVRTSHFFWLDDDDALPTDYISVLQECLDCGTPVAYTDEMTGDGTVLRREEYSQAAHIRNPQLVHHLALYETRAAWNAAVFLPRGHFNAEMMLSWRVAKLGAAYIPRVGYIWNRHTEGMHRWPLSSLAQMRTRLWAKEN